MDKAQSGDLEAIPIVCPKLGGAIERHQGVRGQHGRIGDPPAYAPALPPLISG